MWGVSEIQDENDVDGYEWIVILVLISGTSINGVWCDDVMKGVKLI